MITKIPRKPKLHFDVYRKLELCAFTRKFGYSRRHARAIKKKLRAEGVRGLEVFRCPLCGQCHIGNAASN